MKKHKKEKGRKEGRNKRRNAVHQPWARWLLEDQFSTAAGRVLKMSEIRL
jgi:hypothetical protein